MSKTREAAMDDRGMLSTEAAPNGGRLALDIDGCSLFTYIHIYIYIHVIAYNRYGNSEKGNPMLFRARSAEDIQSGIGFS